MNLRDQQEKELTNRRLAMESIETCIDTGRTNEDGDFIISGEQEILIRLLLEEV